MININWENFNKAEELIGKKALLLGGGAFMNAFTVVEVLSSNRETGQFTVKDGSGTRSPYIWSYYIKPLRDDLQDLELGDYIMGFNGDIRKQDGGLFGTIYNCTLVKQLNNNKEEFINV